MSRYDRLGDYLRAVDSRRVELSFDQIETILGKPLPRSARLYRPWWGNVKAAHAHAWIRAGWLTDHVDLGRERVVFIMGEHRERGSGGDTPPILDGTAALEELVGAAGWPSLEAALAAHTVFLDPATVEQTNGKAVAPVARNMNRRGELGATADGRPVMFDDNTAPTDAFLWSARRRKGPDVQFNHVWQCSDDPDSYTALWNLCCTPAFLAKATDSHPRCQAALQYRSWHLYGFRPSAEQVPVKPDGYDTWSWAPMPEPVPNLEATLRSRLATTPLRRITVAARTIGWAFSDGPDPLLAVNPSAVPPP